MRSVRRLWLTVSVALITILGAVAPVVVSSANATTAVTATTFWNNTKVHTVAITMAKADITKVITDYRASQTKTWVKATITLDGRTFSNVGMRLKGNSSLRSVSTSATAQSLPWLVRLDKYTKTQNLNGMTSFVIRSNTTATSLNEAIALNLIGAAGLETQRAIATKLTVNGSKPALRLVIDNMDDYYYTRVFKNAGILYKADAQGDYSYRGDTATAYTDVFDQETSKDHENFSPLTTFLKFVNQATDAEFAAQLPNYLDINKFAKYLAVMSLIDNFDDIEGPGNNSYLQYDQTTGKMTVVAWDENLAFGQTPQAGGFGNLQRDQFNPGGAMPQLGQFDTRTAQGGFPRGQQFDTRTAQGGLVPLPVGAPDTSTALGALPGGQIPQGALQQFGNRAGGGRGMSGNNILTTRFRANTAFAKLITDATATLKAKLYTSGYANTVLTKWEKLLKAQASTVVTTSKIASETAAIRTYFTK